MTLSNPVTRFNPIDIIKGHTKRSIIGEKIEITQDEILEYYRISKFATTTTNLNSKTTEQPASNKHYIVDICVCK